MFINFSNHPSSRWYGKQLDEAKKYGDIIDVPFPMVDPELTEEQIEMIANEYTKIIMENEPQAVMCSGEFSLTFAVVKKLLNHRIKCVCACTKRVAMEETLEDGTVKKISNFEFVKFREYQ